MTAQRGFESYNPLNKNRIGYLNSWYPVGGNVCNVWWKYVTGEGFENKRPFLLPVCTHHFMLAFDDMSSQLPVLGTVFAMICLHYGHYPSVTISPNKLYKLFWSQSFKTTTEAGVVAQTFNHRTREAEAVRSLSWRTVWSTE